MLLSPPVPSCAQSIRPDCCQISVHAEWCENAWWLQPPPEWKRARLDDHHYGNDDSTIDDEGVNHMGATEVEDVRMANEVRAPSRYLS